MKTVLLWVYIGAFVLLAGFSWLDDEGPSETAAEAAVDYVLTTLLLTGMLFYALRVQRPGLIRAWKLVAPAVLIAEIVQLALAWRDIPVGDAELPVWVEQAVVAGVMVFFALFLTPAIVMNFRFASGRHLVR